jgi:hypothetical protein
MPKYKERDDIEREYIQVEKNRWMVKERKKRIPDIGSKSSPSFKRES